MCRQTDKRHNAALAIVISAHDEQNILYRDHDHEGPKHEGKYAQHGLCASAAATKSLEALPEGVNWAGANVPIDNTQRADEEHRLFRLITMLRARALHC